MTWLGLALAAIAFYGWLIGLMKTAARADARMEELCGRRCGADALPREVSGARARAR